jgi:hypothetical protein
MLCCGTGVNFLQTNLLCELRRVAFVQQAARHRHKIGVTEPERAISEGQLHRFGDDVDKVGRVRTKGLEIELLENVQDLRDMHATGTGGGKPTISNPRYVVRNGSRVLAT